MGRVILNCTRIKITLFYLSLLLVGFLGFSSCQNQVSTVKIDNSFNLKKEVNFTESEAQSAFSGYSQSSKEMFTYVIFTRATIESVLNKDGITSLRYYPAIKDNHKTVIIVGVREDGSEDKSSYFATSNIASNELNTVHIQANEANNLVKFEKKSATYG